MNGTSFSQTREICLTPPRMTTAVSTVTTAPEMAGSIPNEVRMTSVMAWDCTVQPAPKVRQHGKDRKEDGQPLDAQAALDCIHGAAAPSSHP